MSWKQLDEATQQERRDIDSVFRGKARFLVDESVGMRVAQLLQDTGYSAKFVSDLGLRGRSDEEIFAKAWKEQRVIITHDSDFMDNRKFPQHRNPGVVLIRPGSEGKDNEGLFECLAKVVLIARKNASFFRYRKLDFSSKETVLITSQAGRSRYFWPQKGQPLIWKDNLPTTYDAR